MWALIHQLLLLLVPLVRKLVLDARDAPPEECREEGVSRAVDRGDGGDSDEMIAASLPSLFNAR